MKILAIDIGSGTQDILYYNTDFSIENSTKLVFPSPHIYFSKLIENSKNIHIKGDIIGGGKLKNTILNHIKNGYKVTITENAAKTIRDDLNQVRKLNIEISNDNIYNSKEITLEDININKLSKIIKNFDLDFKIDKIAVALQDHGYNPNFKDRDFRFETIKNKLSTPLAPEEFAYFSPPDYLTRMNSQVSNIKRNLNITPLIMDSKFASICGMVDNKTSSIVIDIGNGHTTAASIKDGKIQGLFEHHTSNLNKNKLELYINKLKWGTLTNEEIFNDNGHGAHILNKVNNSNLIVTGPRRNLIKETNLNYKFATPIGDVMMTGTYGLIKALDYHAKV